MTDPRVPPARLDGGGWGEGQRARWAAVAEDCEQAATLAQEAGYPGQATALRNLRARMSASAQESVPVVMFIGEPSVGKSSLINAMLGHHGLSPVGAGVTTTVPVVFGQGAELAARAAGTSEVGPATVPLKLSDLAGVVTGKTEVLDGGAPLAVSCVEIDVPSPVLAGLRILDTPGVFGLGSQHASITDILLAGADALVLVVQATAPLSQPEADLAVRAATGAVSVIVAASHTDASPEPERAVRDLSDRLAAASPLLAGVPVLATSATNAERAASLTGADARVVESRAGVEPLLAQVRGAVTGCPNLRTTRSVLSSLAGRCGQVAAALSARLAAATTADETESVAAAQQRVEALSRMVSRDSRLAVQTAAADALTGFRYGSEDFASAARRVRKEYLNRADNDPPHDLARLPERLCTELDQQAASILAAKIIRLSEQVAETVAATFAGGAEPARSAGDVETLTRRLAARLPAAGPDDLPTPEIIVRGQGLDDASRAQAVASNAILTSALAGSVGSLLSGNPIALVLGGVSVGAGILRNRSTKKAAAQQGERARRAAVASAISGGVGEFIAEFSSFWSRMIHDVEAGVRAALDEIFEEEQEALAMARSDLQRLLAEGSATREEQRRLAEVRDALAARAAAAAAQLRALRLPGAGVAA